MADLVGSKTDARWLVIGKSDIPRAVCVEADAILKPKGELSFAPKTFDYALVNGSVVRLYRPVFLVQTLLKIARKSVIIYEKNPAKYDRWDLGVVRDFNGATLMMHKQMMVLSHAS